MRASFLSTFALIGAVFSHPSSTPWGTSQAAPSVTVKNGTIKGLYNEHYKQDLFLGVPFAQPPLGELRFRNPQSINETFAHTVQATAYATECVGYGGDQIGYPASEDCLYLNIVRPSGYEGQDLPVAVWIHGGGLVDGGTRDKRYNISFIVENSVAIGKPFIGVSIPYRLGPWGFLQSHEVSDSGNTNIGLRDQRLALHWLQENIAAFGGDRKKVTIWGESAGAGSVGWHLTAYDGRDDGLFRAAIMESGNPVSYQSYQNVSFYQPSYDSVLKQTGCSGNGSSGLECLRSVPFAKLNDIFNTTFAAYWQPLIDGDFLREYGSIQLKQGKFVHVPIIDGANTDEGTSMIPPGVNTTASLIAQATNTSNGQSVLPAKLVPAMLEAYPNTPDYWIPTVSEVGNITFPPPYGDQYRRSAAWWGDVSMIANRRLTCETWAAAGLDAYSYRFNTIPAGIAPAIGVTHFMELSFVMNNTQGLGYDAAHDEVDPFLGKPESFFQLAKLMSSSWASFIHDLDPNGFRGRYAAAEPWPKYAVESPRNIVWDANRTELAYTEDDTFREKGIRFIIDHSLDLQR